jgi:hypothetical protein
VHGTRRKSAGTTVDFYAVARTFRVDANSRSILNSQPDLLLLEKMDNQGALIDSGNRGAASAIHLGGTKGSHLALYIWCTEKFYRQKKLIIE